MSKYSINILVAFFCVCQVAATDYTTLIHHKDGRVFAIASDQIDSITHTDHVTTDYYDLTDSIIYPPHMEAMKKILMQATAGAANSVLCNQENMDALFMREARYERAGEPWTHSAMFSLIDDDALDEFIPSSCPGKSISNSDKKVGGYFSLLYPFIRSLETKYGVSLSCGIAAEGQRIGLTPYWSASDECAINENGQLMQQLLAHTNWELLCHSMTGRISPDESIYIVDSLNSREAKKVLAKGKWGGAYSFYTAGVYDRQTQKNYTITSERKQWVETPKKYIQPYCYDMKTGHWVYNESYPLEYQIGEWKRRATQLGFTYPDIMVHWGNTTTGQLINNSRTYFSHSVDPNGQGDGVNNVPLPASIHRINGITGSNNAYNATHYQKLKKAVDNASATHGWLVIMTHFNTINFYNGYLDGVNYPNKDNSYNPEWINPLITEEINSMDENNYWDTPPARLGISNWGEWQPAQGTQLWGLYHIMAYAIEKQLQNVSPSEGVRTAGNIVNIGIYRDKGLYPREKSMQLRPIDKCYYVVGADGSIQYESQK